MTDEEIKLECKRLEINKSVDELVLTIAKLQKENAELKVQIEKMKSEYEKLLDEKIEIENRLVESRECY